MKKIIFAAIIAAASYSLSAQVVVYRLESTGTDRAYSVPEYIRVNFQSTYPAVITVNWEPVVSIVDPSTTLWRASYRENNRLTQVYYNANGVSHRVSLPVISTFVPEEVVTAAMDKYGSSLYSITMMKPIGDIEIYQLRLLDQTEPRSIWIDESGLEMSEAEYKLKMDDFKLKVENDKIKVKTEEDKMKAKIDQ